MQLKHSLCSLEQRVVAADNLPEVQRHVSYLVVQDPSQVQKGRGIANYSLGLTHCTVPVRVLDIFSGHFIIPSMGGHAQGTRTDPAQVLRDTSGHRINAPSGQTRV